MNKKQSKRIVATHNSIDPSLVTAEDLVRAIRNRDLESLRSNLDFTDDNFTFSTYSDWELWAIQHIADLITLPEDKPIIRDERTHQPYEIVADYQDEALPFSEPIDGVEQEPK